MLELHIRFESKVFEIHYTGFVFPLPNNGSTMDVNFQGHFFCVSQ